MPKSSFSVRTGLRVAPFVASALLGIVPLLTGCQNNAGSGGSSQSLQPTTIATVNGTTISSDLMFDAMQHYVPVKSSADQNSSVLTEPIGRVVLTELIQDQILQQLATQKNVPVTDDLVNGRYDYIKKIQEGVSTTKPFDDYLADEGYTADTFKTEQIRPLIARLNLVSIGQNLTDADVLAYYNLHPEKYSFPLRAHIQRVVLPDEASADAARTDAQTNGSFKNSLARSIDPPLTGGDDGSDLAHWEPLEGPNVQLPPQLLGPLKAAKTGDVLPPVQLQPGRWWVVRVAAVDPAQKLPFDQVKNQVKLDAAAEKGMTGTGIASLQQNLAMAVQMATITVVPKEYQSLVDELKAKPALPSSPGAPAQR